MKKAAEILSYLAGMSLFILCFVAAVVTIVEIGGLLSG